MTMRYRSGKRVLCIFTDADPQAIGQNCVRALSIFNVAKTVEDEQNEILWGMVDLPNPGWVKLREKGNDYAIFLSSFQSS